MISPAGWRLPVGGGNSVGTASEFVALNIATGASDYNNDFAPGIVNALQLPLSGYFNGGSSPTRKSEFKVRSVSECS